MTPRTVRPGAQVTVAYQTRSGEVTAVVGTVVTDRYPDSALAVDTDRRGVLRLPWANVVKVVVQP